MVLSPAVIDDLIKARKVEANTRAEFARTGLGIGVPKGAAKPDVTSVDALKRAFLSAKSVGYEAESQPGTQFLEVIERLGIAQEMRSKLKALPNPSEALAKREVEMHIGSVGRFWGILRPISQEASRGRFSDMSISRLASARPRKSRKRQRPC